MPVDVSSNGAITLGDSVTCDGFIYGYPYRVQSHIHQDHMNKFSTSKGNQDIFMSEATKQLLISEYDADIVFRSNIHSLSLGKAHTLDGLEIEILPSGHMLGAVQVSLISSSQGDCRVGYSGDFNWPLDETIEVDTLVLDSTGGNPDLHREYSQKEVASRFADLVIEQLAKGPVLIKSDPGPIHTGLAFLEGLVNCPVLATESFARTAIIHRHFGHSIGPILGLKSEEAKRAMKKGRYIRIYCRNEIPPYNPKDCTVISLSAYMVGNEDPVLKFSESSYRVGLSAHADFDGTLEYVKKTGAQRVITDNSRSGHGIELAIALRTYLGIEAKPSSQVLSHFWGN